MNFAISSNPSPSELADSVNYLLGNLGSSGAQYNASTGTITQNGVVIGYLYRYLWLKYATSFNGTTGFSNSPTNATYYGLRNTDSNVESNTPSDYIWYSGTFSTTNFFWFLTTGGRKLNIFIGTSTPGTGWLQDTGNAIDLDQVNSVPVVPVVSSYGEKTIINNATGTVCTLQNTFYQITAGWATGDLSNFTAGASSLVSTLGGPAYTVCSASISTTSSNQVYNVQIFKNGIAIPSHNGTIKLVNSTDVNSVTVTGIIGSVSPADIFTVWIQNMTSAAQTVTVQYANFVVFNI